MSSALCTAKTSSATGTHTRAGWLTTTRASSQAVPKDGQVDAPWVAVRPVHRPDRGHRGDRDRDRRRRLARGRDRPCAAGARATRRRRGPRARPRSPRQAAGNHGELASAWTSASDGKITASALIRRVSPDFRRYPGPPRAMAHHGRPSWRASAASERPACLAAGARARARTGIPRCPAPAADHIDALPAAVGDALRDGPPEAEPGPVDAGKIESGAPVADDHPQAARDLGAPPPVAPCRRTADPGLPGPRVRRHVRQGLAHGVRDRRDDPGRDGRPRRVIDLE